MDVNIIIWMIVILVFLFFTNVIFLKHRIYLLELKLNILEKKINKR
jgi:cell division protein FtsL